ncbi:nitrile hydratase [Marinobacter psychrophilus]|jgi:nitrile hydratase|uniref:nitrile hydratase n=1 Tax=Marinobacter psychrophilus TaxID=330734 RepID=A0A0H4I083_9GAMM|nr:nitrile hydratase subunit alpha [Marinobacter psychrophilus]AKO52366.1 nitrile hydratase [Marinobacter psychrophilus]MBQ0761893.1 nitrile hydratase subunit alpha [Marinobacter psychrophilus]MBQ0845221.1 nitrile hydratase subunit alpha [Marinobacter psychrophilus]
MQSLFKYVDDREQKNAARAMALEDLLIKKGLITQDSIDTILEYFETKMGPFNGARIVARAWTDESFKQYLLQDTPGAIASMDFPTGMAGAEGEHMKAVANAPSDHNMIICTLCSCYPFPVLGLPPYWYKDPSFRSRAVREPRAVLKEFGVNLPSDVQVHLWDSSAQIRWFVIPEQPLGTEDWTEEELVKLVTPESMMGVAMVEKP